MEIKKDLDYHLQNVIDNENNAHLDNVIEDLNDFVLERYNCNINELQILKNAKLEKVKQILNNYFN